MGFLYNFFNELEDESQKSTWKKGFRFLFKNYKVTWLNVKTSSDNKWDLDANGKRQPYVKKWYHFGVATKYKEAFAFSSTLRVFKTDGEHWFQFWKNNAILVGIVAINLPAMVCWLVGKSTLQFVKEKYWKNIN